MSVHAAHVPRSHLQILTNTGNARMPRITHQVHHHDLHDEQVNLPATPAAPQAAAAASNGGGAGAGAGAGGAATPTIKTTRMTHLRHWAALKKVHDLT